MVYFIFVVAIVVGVLWLFAKLLSAFIKWVSKNKHEFCSGSLINAGEVLAFAVLFLILSGPNDREYPFERITPPVSIEADAPERITAEGVQLDRAFSSRYAYYGQYGDVIVLKSKVTSNSRKDYEDTQACCLVSRDGRLLTRGNEYYIYAGLSTKYLCDNEPVIVCENRLISLDDGTIIAKGVSTYYSLSGRELDINELEKSSDIPLERFDKRSIDSTGINGSVFEPTGDVICIKRGDEYDYYIKE